LDAVPVSSIPERPGKRRQVLAAAQPQRVPASARPLQQEFLNLWKDADPDIPVLKQARIEYAKLK
jgi:hypothetical protein